MIATATTFQTSKKPSAFQISRLQPAHTNLLQRKCACGGTSGLTGECEECRHRRLSDPRGSSTLVASAGVTHELNRPVHAHARVLPPNIAQAELSVGRPGDEYEQEANRIADQVMRGPQTTGQSTISKSDGGVGIRLKCSGCEEESKLQRQSVDDEEDQQQLAGKEIPGQVLQLTPSLAANIAHVRRNGTPLPVPVRSFFEPRFGHDFSRVQVHLDSNAAESARAVRARAYTVGQDIVFGTGQYEPEKPQGQQLIAHELVHVLQQTGGQRIMRQEDPGAARATQYVQGPDEQSAQIPKWVADFFSSGSPVETPDAAIEPPNSSQPAKDEATVSTKSAAMVGWRESPERDASAEAAYPSGMSHGQLADQLGAGRPLESNVRFHLERRYERPLSDVRVHDDGNSAKLSEQFGAKAFAFGNHIAFGSGAYAPQTSAGFELLRHEVSHVLGSIPSPGGVFRAGLCSGTCPPAGALPFVPVSDRSFNCYAYATNSPASGFRQPGQSSGTPDFLAISGPPSAAASAAAARYFTPAGMLANMTADLGSPISTTCNACCTSPKRKIIGVTTDSMAVVGAANWDFHWYRKDSDRAWSHKPGATPAKRSDAAGASPICNPCTSSRNFSPLNYNNVVGSWCV